MLTIFLTVLRAMLKRTLFVQLFLLAALSVIGCTSAGRGVGGGDADHEDANGLPAGQLRDADSEAGKTMTANRQLVSGKGKGKGKGEGKGKGKGKGKVSWQNRTHIEWCAFCLEICQSLTIHPFLTFVISGKWQGWKSIILWQRKWLRKRLRKRKRKGWR